jgi:hypothetical protein
MNFINYKFVQQNNGQETTCALNLNNVAQVTPVLNEQGYVEFLQILTDLPTEQGFKSYPVNGTVDSEGRIKMNRKGEAEIKFANKSTQTHFFIVIRGEKDIQALLPVFGIDPNEFKYLSEMPASVEQLVETEENVEVDPDPPTEV